MLRSVVGEATLFVSSCKSHRHLLQRCVRGSIRIFHNCVWCTRVNGELLFSKVLIAVLVPAMKQDGRTWEESVNASNLPKTALYSEYLLKW